MGATIGLTESFAAQGRSDGISLLIGSGSVAVTNLGGLVYELRRRLPRPVVVVLTEGAQRFVTAMSIAHVGGCAVVTDELLAPDTSPLHLWLTDLARVVVVYPASASFLSRAACAAASDLASTTLVCAAGLPILIVPSMHKRMWANSLVQDNVAALERAGMSVVRTSDGTAPPVSIVVDEILAVGRRRGGRTEKGSPTEFLTLRK